MSKLVIVLLIKQISLSAADIIQDINKANMLCYPHIPHHKKPRVIFILGGPGSGKGTQSKLIQQKYNLHHMSAGDLLREQRKNANSEHGKLIDQYMVQGKIVPCEITVKLLEAEMRRKGYLQGKFLIDGFPRNKQNLRRWHIHTHPQVVVPFIVVLQCGEACMLQRLLNRGKTSGRIDDNIEVIKKRFETYNKQTKEVIDYFKNQNRAVIVSAEGSVEQTFKLVCEQIDAKLK